MEVPTSMIQGSFQKTLQITEHTEWNQSSDDIMIPGELSH